MRLHQLYSLCNKFSIYSTHITQPSWCIFPWRRSRLPCSLSPFLSFFSVPPLIYEQGLFWHDAWQIDPRHQPGSTCWQPTCRKQPCSTHCCSCTCAQDTRNGCDFGSTKEALSSYMTHTTRRLRNKMRPITFWPFFTLRTPFFTPFLVLRLLLLLLLTLPIWNFCPPLPCLTLCARICPFTLFANLLISN